MDLPVLAASLVNAKETAKYLHKKGYGNIYLITTGTYQMAGKRYEKPLHSEEDYISALFIGYELSKIANVNEYIFEDYLDILNNPDRLVEYLWDTHYAKYLLALDKRAGNNNNEKDMKICFEINEYPCVPVLQKKKNLLVFKIK